MPRGSGGIQVLTCIMHFKLLSASLSKLVDGTAVNVDA